MSLYVVQTDGGGHLVTVTYQGGITVLGIALGLHPELMLAGLWGAWWQLTSAPPMPWPRRVSLALTASVVAAYCTPAVMLFADRAPWQVSAGDALQYPVAVAVGYLAHRHIGPMLSRIARKKTEDLTR